jgi:hypothetical protein
MATLGGDLIRLLAHTALQTGGNIGVNYLNNMFTEQAKEKLLGLGESIDAARYETDPNKQQEILGQLKGRIGLPTVTENGFAPVGETPTLGNLGQNKNLTYPAESYAPASLERIVAPPVTKLNEALAARAAPAIGQVSPKEALGIATKEPGREAARDNLIATLAAKKYEADLRSDDKSLDRRQRADAARESNEIKLLLGQGMQQIHLQGQQNAADKNKFMATFLSGKTQDADEAKAHTLIGNAANAYNITPMSNVDAKVAAANRFNALIDTYGEKYPDAVSGYTRLEPKTPESFFGLRGGNVLPGLTPSKGTMNTPTATVPSAPIGDPIAAAKELERRKKVRGGQ